MAMTKKDARAIIACGNRITKALDACLNQLSEKEQQYARAYWAAHIQSAMHGGNYGSAPMEAAYELLSGAGD